MSENEGSWSPVWGGRQRGQLNEEFRFREPLIRQEMPVALDTKRRQKFIPVQVCQNCIQGSLFPSETLCQSRYRLSLPLPLDAEPMGGTFSPAAVGSSSQFCLPPQKCACGPRPDPGQHFCCGQVIPGYRGSSTPRTYYSGRVEQPGLQLHKAPRKGVLRAPGGDEWTGPAGVSGAIIAALILTVSLIPQRSHGPTSV